MPFLTVVRGSDPRVFELVEGRFVAGRSPEAALYLGHVEISRQHCRFCWDGQELTIEDLGSARGTQVNGTRISQLTTLRLGDQIALGPAVLEYGNAAPAPGASAARKSPPVEAAPMLIKGQPAGRIEAAGADLMIGRDEDADVVLKDPGISRRHAKLSTRPGGGCVVSDLHSSSGSFVNGQRFDEHELIVGDRLQLGPFYFHFDGRALVRVANAAGGSLRTLNVTARVGALTILDDVSVNFPPSRFIGILGPSGAGKSTLLHAIAGLRKPQGGRVLADGLDIYEDTGTPTFGFVPQDDIVHPELTVIEALRFGARLRLPKKTPPLELHKLLLQTLQRLGLSARADTPIARLSGGQRKRVSVSVELLAKPAILFLDEPTSGLDPATEFQLMELLRDLADTGCTIVCTTHIMENAFLMDQIVVLTGGCLAFHGTPQQTREYFAVPKLIALYDRLQSRAPSEWQARFLENPAARENEEPPGVATHRISERAAWALPILLARQWAILRADGRNFLILAGQPLIIAALVSWVSDDRALIMFFAYLATLWFGCSNAAQEIVKERSIFQRERLIGVGPHAYLTSKFLFLTTISGLQALLIYGALLGFEGGFDGAPLWQVGALLGTALASVGIGTAISTFSRSVMQAVMIVPLFLIPQIVFSGYTVPASDMSPAVLRVSRLMPSFSAQVLMDTSFLWARPLHGKTISEHGQAYRNLDPERTLSSRDVFTNPKPGLLAGLGLGLWALGTYLASWLALRRMGH